MLSLSEVTIRLCVTFNTEVDSAINRHTDDGTIINFNQFRRGLYYYDATNMESNNTNNQVTDYYFSTQYRVTNHTSTNTKLKEQMQK